MCHCSLQESLSQSLFMVKRRCCEQSVDVAHRSFFLTLKCPVISSQSYISALQIAGVVFHQLLAPVCNCCRNYTSASCHGAKHQTITVKWCEKNGVTFEPVTVKSKPLYS